MARLLEILGQPGGSPVDMPSLPEMPQGGGGWMWLPPSFDASFAFAEQVFTADEAHRIICASELLPPQQAITGAAEQSTEIRDSIVRWMFPNTVTGWIFERLSRIAMELNNQHFGCDLSGFTQGLQITQYDAPSGHYDWHMDRGVNMGNRKLSLCVQLSQPDEYDGGELELFVGSKPVVAPKDVGTLCAFPSYVVHRVKPVTAGRRWSLVAWIAGPPWK